MKPVPTKIVLGIALAAVIVVGALSMVRKDTSELPVYVQAAARMWEGEEIYRPNEEKPFTYPSFFALPFLPLVPLAESKAHVVTFRGREIPYRAYDGVLVRIVWYLLNLGFLALALRAVHRWLREARTGSGPGLVWIWIAIAALAFRHLWAVFSNQSHDLIVLLAVLGVATWGTRPLRTGGAAGAGAACKATPLLFLPVFAWQRRFGAAAALLATLLLLLALPELLFPRLDGQLWSQAWASTFLGSVGPGAPAEAEGAWSKWNLLNQNLAGTLYRLSTPIADTEARDRYFDVSVWAPSASLLKYLTLAAQAAVFALIVFVTRPSLSRNLDERELRFRRFGEAGAVACGMVLLSPMSSKSHFCVLLIGAAFCVADFFWRRRDPVLGALLVAIFATGSLTARDLWGKELGREMLARGSVTLCALLTLAAVAHVLQHRRVPARESEPSPRSEVA